MSDGDTLLQLAQVSSLKDKSDWMALVDRLERKAALEKGRALTAMLGDSEFDQRDADYVRGFIKALEWVKDQPRQAEVAYNTKKGKE